MRAAQVRKSREWTPERDAILSHLRRLLWVNGVRYLSIRDIAETMTTDSLNEWLEIERARPDIGPDLIG